MIPERIIFVSRGITVLEFVTQHRSLDFSLNTSYFIVSFIYTWLINTWKYATIENKTFNKISKFTQLSTRPPIATRSFRYHKCAYYRAFFFQSPPPHVIFSFLAWIFSAAVSSQTRSIVILSFLAWIFSAAVSSHTHTIVILSFLA